MMPSVTILFKQIIPHRRLTVLAVLSVFSIVISACSVTEAGKSAKPVSSTSQAEELSAKNSNDALQYSGKQHAVTAMSKSGDYRFTLYSERAPIPLKKIHSWILKVESKDGRAVENAKLFVFGGMPQHQHGFPTKPQIKKYLGGGMYLVEGIKFSMPGYWEMRFNLKLKKKRIQDRVIFKINLR